jgi:hypothetical protein
MTATTTDAYRRRIDAGETGDKVAFPDPAAAPLGTDEEAAGTRPELPPDAASTSPAAESRRTKLSGPMLYGAIAAALGAALVILAGLALA